MCLTRAFFSTGLLLVLASLYTTASQAAPLSRDDLKINGDVRVRLETDFDSQRADGREREDRTRLRLRLRLGLDIAASDRWSFGLRLRSGSADSHQSPHVTVVDFNNNDTDDTAVNLDKWFAKVNRKKVWAWIGRNRLALWKQNEFLWDDDATPAGLAVGFDTAVGDAGKLTINTGYFLLPSGLRDFAGNLGVGQVVYSCGHYTAAGGVMAFDADADDTDAGRLLLGNGNRDYTLWVGNLQARFDAGSRPLTFGLDVVHNGEHYSASDPDPFTAAHRDQTDGFVISARLGAIRKPGDWLAAYYYADIEALAVNTSYAEDDWVRWGSVVETRSSDFTGHELRFAYALEKHLNLVARLYLVDAITTREDGSRFRLDLNYRF